MSLLQQLATELDEHRRWCEQWIDRLSGAQVEVERVADAYSAQTLTVVSLQRELGETQKKLRTAQEALRVINARVPEDARSARVAAIANQLKIATAGISGAVKEGHTSGRMNVRLAEEVVAVLQRSGYNVRLVDSGTEISWDA